MKSKSSLFTFSSIPLLAMPLIATFVTVLFHTYFLTSIFLFFGIPVLYLGLRTTRIRIRRSVIWSLIFSIPLSLFVDMLATINGSWANGSLFPFRFFGVATVEIWLFGLLWGLFSVLFYEQYYPSENSQSALFSSRYWYLLLLFGFLIFYVLMGFFIFPSLLHIPYFYVSFSLLFVALPLILFLFCYPRFLAAFTGITLYFFYIMFLFEVAALQTGQWNFPGNDFIGSLNILGNRMPIEELVFWMILATPAYLSYYEYFGKGVQENHKNLH